MTEAKRQLLPDENWFWKIVYAVSRTGFFIFVSACLPGAYLYIRGQSAPVWLALPVAIGGCIWTLIYLGLHSYAFPTHGRGALLAFVVPVWNCVASGQATESFLFGAYSVVLAAVVAQCLFLLPVSLAACISPLRRRIFGEDSALWIAPFLSVVFLLIAAFGWTFRAPFLEQMQSTRSFVAMTGFAFQVVMEIRVLYFGSIFSSSRGEDSESSALHEAWAPLMIFCMIGSLAGAGILALWKS